ncbi:SDR family NAD(P)-dependent oxidoreductase [Lysinimonas soli]|uniref:SDR family NAD(P)-dependent oxidoreductase n=1 Tax=Lysinimonas soli TaxID=1074233 RepID=A0ABW0NPG3_9MICO
MTSIGGRVAVVTGGASGIGRGIAQALIQRGAQVVIADIDSAALGRAAEEVGAIGIRCDVADEADVRALAERVLAELGGVGILVNNAGVGPAAPIAEMSIRDWEWILGINLWGVINGISAFLPLLRANPDGGHIVNTASMAALAPTRGLGAYAVGKAGVMALSEVLADELADEGSGVAVSVLVPGPVRTAIRESQRSRPDRGRLVDLDLDRAGFDWVRWETPEAVGALVADAVERNERYIITHPELWHRVEARNLAIRAAFGVNP